MDIPLKRFFYSALESIVPKELRPPGYERAMGRSDDELPGADYLIGPDVTWQLRKKRMRQSLNEISARCDLLAEKFSATYVVVSEDSAKLATQSASDSMSLKDWIITLSDKLKQFENEEISDELSKSWDGPKESLKAFQRTVNQICTKLNALKTSNPTDEDALQAFNLVHDFLGFLDVIWYV